MEAMVELKQVSKRFGSFVAVESVDLVIRAGEFLTLLGPSGCGKTTLLRMISGFETPTRGTIHLGGVDVTGLPPYRRDVNQVFQSYALFPHMTVWSNIAFGLKMKKMPSAEVRSRVGNAVEMVWLSGMEQRKPSQLSGGQKQRVALARALVCQPKVLLLDEPLAALDAKLRRSMQIELKRLQAQLGITFLFVTHDQDEALVMSDRIAVVNNGKIEQIASAAEIYHKPATAFVADFIGAANVLEGTVCARDSDAVTLDCRGIKLTVRADAIIPASDRATVSIRPERLRLSRSALNLPNVFQATVTDPIFRGATDQVLLSVNPNLNLSALVLRTGGDATPPLSRGDRVYVQVDAHDIVVLAGE